jgi:hypothetical protein
MKDNKTKQRSRESGHRKDLQIVRNHNQVTRENNNNDCLIKINLKKIVINYFFANGKYCDSYRMSPL